MTSVKRPADIVEHSLPKKAKTKFPQLSSRSRKAFLYFQLYEKEVSYEFKVIIRQLRSLLVNSQFLNSFFGEEENRMAELCVLSAYNMQIKLRFEDHQMCLQPRKLEHLTSLIRLLSMKKLKLSIENYVSARFRQSILNGWVQICRVLNDNKSLEDIQVQMKSFYSPASRILFDKIPDKISELHIKDDIMSCLSGGRKTLDYLSVSECKSHKYLAYIFKAKTKYLEFTRAPWNGGNGKDGLLSFANCGSLSSNPSIERLKINIQFSIVKKFRLFSCWEGEDDETETIDPEIFYLPDYERALNCLKMVNPEMTLNLIENNIYKDEEFENYNDIIEHLELLIKNANKFLDLAQRIGTKIESIEIRQKYNIHFKAWSYNKTLDLAETFDFEHYNDDQIYGTQYYNDVKIFFDLKFIQEKPVLMFGSFYSLFGSDSSSDDVEEED